MKVQPIYNNKFFKKSLEFAADNGALFVATTSLVLSTVARPIAIMATPKTDKENRKYAASKSLASSIVGYGLMLCASLPLAKSIKKINENPEYLKNTTIKALQDGEKSLNKSKKYKFATQLFKLGLGFILAVPKSIMTCAMIPTIMEKMFNSGKLKVENEKNNYYRIARLQNCKYGKDSSQKITSFTGTTDKLAKGIGKIIDTQVVIKLTEKFHNTNFEMHIMALTDTLATGSFIHKGVECSVTAYRVKLLNDGINKPFTFTEHTEAKWVPVNQIKTLSFVDSDLKRQYISVTVII